MERVISVSFGELVLKGGNRRYFEDRLIQDIIKAIKPIGYNKLYREQGKVYIECDFSNTEEIIKRLEKIFGLVYISPCIRVDKEDEAIVQGVKEAVSSSLNQRKIKTFKVETNRVDKKYPIKSPEMSRNMGGLILKTFNDLRVDVHNPDMLVNIDIKDKVYIYTERIPGAGGMPGATNGRGLVLLSGGIDSPVAAYMMAKRGLGISAVHYHSFPFTSERAEEKVKELARILSQYTGDITMYSVNILEIQKEINKNCRPEEMTILSRRFMMKIADRIAQEESIEALITGENLGQVASQTIQGLTVTNAAVTRPVFRPLIAFDKVDIINLAKKIGSYETSILPYEDCCTVFLPKNPLIKPKLKKIEGSEEKLDVNGLIDRAIESMEKYKVSYS